MITSKAGCALGGNMVAKKVEKFYNSYKRNLYEIRHIEKTIFADAYDYGKWETALREKS